MEHVQKQEALRQPAPFSPSTVMAVSGRAVERLTPTQWLVCAVAGIGFLFDTYEIVVQSIVVRPALLDIADFVQGSRQFNRWIGWLLYLPFFAGGVAGLIGGYLTDSLGRRRVLVWSIALYGVATVGAACATSPLELLIWRCVTIIAVSTEWIAAAAWIAELFPERRRREAALGFTQAMSGIGVFLVACVYYLSVTYGQHWVAIAGTHAGWRYALIFGALPVLPVLLARLRTPESAEWLQLRTREGRMRPSFRELFKPQLRRVTIVSTALVASIYGLGYATVSQMPRIVPGLAGVRDLSRIGQEQTISFVHFMQDFGGLVGRFAIAFLAISWLTRRRVLRMFQLPALMLVPILFATAPYLNLTVLACGALLSGVLVNGQVNFIGNYLPQIYPTHLRGTGESFAISIGGRIIGAAAAFLTPWLSNFTPGADATQKLSFACASIAVVACTLGWLTSHFLVEPDPVGAS
jgi:MFS family permease